MSYSCTAIPVYCLAAVLPYCQTAAVPQLPGAYDAQVGTAVLQKYDTQVTGILCVLRLSSLGHLRFFERKVWQPLSKV